MSQTILLEVTDGVAVVTLNRPEKLNAFADDMREQLIATLDEVASRVDVRVLVITGAGKGFCSGGDVQHMVGLKQSHAPFSALEPLLEAGRGVLTRLAAFEMPVIAAVNGVAAGAGCNLALACDVRVASAEARFGETFVRIGLHVDWAGVHHLPRLIGTANALDWCWTGELIGAEEALRLGLVQRVWPAQEFAERWRGYARQLADAPQTSVHAAKRTLRASLARTLAQNMDAEVAAQAACWSSPDSDEGLRAFIEKRPARFAAAAFTEDGRPPSAAARRFE